MKCKLTNTEIFDLLDIDQSDATEAAKKTALETFKLGYEKAAEIEYAKGYNDGAKDTLREADHPAVEIYEDEY